MLLGLSVKENDINSTDMTSVCGKYEIYRKFLSLSLKRRDGFSCPESELLLKIRYTLEQEV